MKSKLSIIGVLVLTLLVSIPTAALCGGIAGYLTASILPADGTSSPPPTDVPGTPDTTVTSDEADIPDTATPPDTEKAKENEPPDTVPPTPTAAPEAQKSVADIAQMCTKSVVSITVRAEKKKYSGGSTVSEEVIGHGTGVIIRENGYIVTCHHVIDGADRITVILNETEEHDARLIGFDETFDLAVIRVEKTNLPAAVPGDSDAMISGESVVVIGNPLGEFGSSVSAGVLSSPSRDLTIADVPLRLMQTDAAVNPGNSGGGLFDMKGKLVGIVNAKISSSGIEGIGFAIPWNTIREKTDTIIESGSTGAKASLGISTKKAVYYIGKTAVSCLEIVSVRTDSPADRAGLQAGDYLLSADGKKLTDNDALTLTVKYHAPGDRITFELYRDGTKRTISVVLGSS